VQAYPPRYAAAADCSGERSERAGHLARALLAAEPALPRRRRCARSSPSRRCRRCGVAGRACVAGARPSTASASRCRSAARTTRWLADRGHRALARPLPRPGLVLRLDSGHASRSGSQPRIRRRWSRPRRRGRTACGARARAPDAVYGRAGTPPGSSAGAACSQVPLFAALVAGVVQRPPAARVRRNARAVQLQGAVPYVTSFLGYWAAVSVSLVLCATVWRWPASWWRCWQRAGASRRRRASAAASS
jgi:hypothetical protein